MFYKGCAKTQADIDDENLIAKLFREEEFAVECNKARAELDALNDAGLPDNELDALWQLVTARQEAKGIFV